MKTKIYYLLFFIIFSFLSLNCTHVNELYKYDLSSGTFYFKYYVNPKVSQVDVELNNYEYGNKLPLIILTEIGESYLGNAVKEKLNRAIKPDSITKLISDGIKEGLITYYNIIPVDSLGDEPDYIVETQLNGFTLTSNSNGVYANIDTKIFIISQGNAGTAWESGMCSSYPIQDILLGYSSSPWVRTAGGVINAVRLMQMTEEEIKAAINATVLEASKDQTERLREDIYIASETEK
jgi:hypothetical protein